MRAPIRSPIFRVGGDFSEAGRSESYSTSPSINIYSVSEDENIPLLYDFCVERSLDPQSLTWFYLHGG
jgi:hypothetical protein